MDQFNLFGFVFVVLLMIPNVIFAAKYTEYFQADPSCKSLEIIELIGRGGCVAFMIFNLPGTYFGWWSDEGFAIYLIADTTLLFLYCVAWIAFTIKRKPLTAMILAILPSLLFLFSGIMSRSLLLILSALLFAPTHILVSYRNVKLLK